MSFLRQKRGKCINSDKCPLIKYAYCNNGWVCARCPPIFIKYRLTTLSDRDLVTYAFVSHSAFCLKQKQLFFAQS